MFKPLLILLLVLPAFAQKDFPDGAAKRYSLNDVKRPLEGWRRHGSSWVQTTVDIEPRAYLEGDDVADRRRHGKDVAPCLR